MPENEYDQRIPTSLCDSLLTYLGAQDTPQAQRYHDELRHAINSNLINCPECGWQGTHLDGSNLACSRCGFVDE